MGLKLRKMVMKRKGLCDLVVGATKVQGPEIGGALGEYLSPVLAEGETLPDLAKPLELYGRKLEGFRDAMVEADADYLKQPAAFADLRLESQAPTGKLKGSILSLRSTCEGLLGKESLRSLGLDFNLAQDPPGVVRQGEITPAYAILGDERIATASEGTCRYSSSAVFVRTSLATPRSRSRFAHSRRSTSPIRQPVQNATRIAAQALGLAPSASSSSMALRRAAIWSGVSMTSFFAPRRSSG